MLTPAYFQRLFRHNTLSNYRILDALRALSRPVDEELRLLSHILQAERLWFLRLESIDTGAPDTWPRLTLSEAEDAVRINGITARAYIGRLSDDALSASVQYSTARGDIFRNTVTDILTHLTQHGSYHRAQINRLLRDQGDMPVSLDFIGFARQRWEDPRLPGDDPGR